MIDLKIIEVVMKITYQGIEYKQINLAPYFYVSKCGKVVRCTDGDIKELPLVPDSRGFQRVTIRTNLGTRTKGVHLLVYDTWKGSLHRGAKVLHKDADRTNNSADNLMLKGIPVDRHADVFRMMSKARG